jgi:hypothetical protein
MANGPLRRLDDDLFAGRLTRRAGFIAARTLVLWAVVGAVLGFTIGLVDDSNGCFGCIPVAFYTGFIGGVVGGAAALVRFTLVRRRRRRTRT